MRWRGLLVKAAALIAGALVVRRLLVRAGPAPAGPDEEPAPVAPAPVAPAPERRPVEPPPPAHEPEGTGVRAVSWFVAGLLLTGAAVFGGTWALAVALDRRPRAPRAPPWSAPGPAPRAGSGADAPWLHWVDPDRDADLVLGAQRARLATYGWVDASAGVVRVPIERAAEAIAAGADPQELMRAAGREGLK